MSPPLTVWLAVLCVHVQTGALLASAAAASQMKVEKRFVTGGCDNRIRIWKSALTLPHHLTPSRPPPSHLLTPPPPPPCPLPPSPPYPFSPLSSLRQSDVDGSWEESLVFTNGASAPSHDDWVRDVAWAPSLGLPSNTIASASEDRSVALWYEGGNGEWSKGQVLRFEGGVWRVSWSVNGNVLAVSQGDQKVSLWKETGEGQWKQVSTEQAQNE